jgi:hypothetical protein
MPANEFEKQVQEKMEDFRLNPSASVWKNVEDELKEKRKKRIIFFFILPVAILLLLIPGYYLISKPAADSRKLTVVSPEAGVGSRGAVANSQKSIVDSQHPASSNQHPASNVQYPVSSIQPSASSNSRLLKNKRDKTIANVDFSVSNPAIQQKTDAEGDVGKISTAPVVIGQATTDNNAVDKKQTDAVAVNTDKPEVKNAPKTEEPKQAVVKKERGKTTTRWGLDFSVGVSSIQTEPFPKLKFGASADALFAGSTQNFPNGIPVGGAAPPTPPSNITQGLSFRLGYRREWQVSERSSFSGGLQYAYASTHMKIGSAVDSTLRVATSYNNYASMPVYKSYHAGDKDKYTNSYHFVAVPLGYHWLINKKLPIQLNFEVSLSYLLSTNALIYNSSNGGIYYRDEDAFNKMQFAIGTGLSYRFKTKKGTEWVMGPQLSFNTSSLLTNDHRQYLFFGGLNAQLFFPKKKK